MVQVTKNKKVRKTIRTSPEEKKAISEAFKNLAKEMDKVR